MTKINEEDLRNIQGGGLSVWGAIGIGTIVTFLIGVIDGFVRPLKCN